MPLVEASNKKQDPYERSRAKKPLNNIEDAVIIGGSSNPSLAISVAEHLGTKLAETKI